MHSNGNENRSLNHEMSLVNSLRQLTLGGKDSAWFRQNTSAEEANDTSRPETSTTSQKKSTVYRRRRGFSTGVS